jgi:hypothetical protein
MVFDGKKRGQDRSEHASRAHVDCFAGALVSNTFLPLITALAGTALIGSQNVARPYFDNVINLETTSEDSANVSMGDLDGDGDLDLVLAKGRHTPIVDKVLLNDGRGGFVASNLGPIADRTYTAALADLEGDGDLDLVISNDTPDKKLVYLNNGKGQFTLAGTWGAPEWSTRNCALADLNADGKVDVIAANRPGPSYVCLNDGKGGRTASASPPHRRPASCRRTSTRMASSISRCPAATALRVTSISMTAKQGSRGSFHSARSTPRRALAQWRISMATARSIWSSGTKLRLRW